MSGPRKVLTLKFKSKFIGVIRQKFAQSFSRNFFHFYVHDIDFIITGTLELRKAISKWHFEMEGLLHKPDQIVVGTGSKELIFLAMNIFYGGKNHHFM